MESLPGVSMRGNFVLFGVGHNFQVENYNDERLPADSMASNLSGHQTAQCTSPMGIVSCGS